MHIHHPEGVGKGTNIPTTERYIFTDGVDATLVSKSTASKETQIFEKISKSNSNRK